MSLLEYIGGHILINPKTYVVAAVALPVFTGLARLLTGQNVAEGLEQVASPTVKLGALAMLFYLPRAVSKAGRPNGGAA
jgi:hypothetical protein